MKGNGLCPQLGRNHPDTNRHASSAIAAKPTVDFVGRMTEKGLFC
jgi:hypothetical protein